jgi:peptide-methionine (S)-S-oxide reductase
MTLLTLIFSACILRESFNFSLPHFDSQYRSAIVFHNAEQEEAAKRSKEKQQMSGKFTREIVTEITPASEYYLAEDYHQPYFEKRGRHHI